jgi:hypothetical protein
VRRLGKLLGKLICWLDGHTWPGNGDILERCDRCGEWEVR